LPMRWELGQPSADHLVALGLGKFFFYHWR
jgi:hypothetical protein